jgi:hypothetical protein
MRKGRLVKWSGIATVLLALSPQAVMAQNTGIAGLVKDASGAVLPGVTV